MTRPASLLPALALALALLGPAPAPAQGAAGGRQALHSRLIPL